MKIKEKMEVFRKFTIELASKESEASLRDFQSSCDRKMEAFRRNRQAEMVAMDARENHLLRQIFTNPCLIV